MNLDDIRNRNSLSDQFDEWLHEGNPNRKLIIAVEGRYKATAEAVIGLVKGLDKLIPLYTCSRATPESQSDLENIDRALREGANINYQEHRYGYTALILAARLGFLEIVRHLIQKGANPEIKEDMGYNAYTMAMYYLKSYENFYNESFRDISRSEDNDRYRNNIALYQNIVTLLHPVTLDHSLPDERCNCTIL